MSDQGDDISPYASEDAETQAGVRRELSGFDGPAVWDDVDHEEIARIAVRVSRSVLPSTDTSEVANRLAMQAAALDSDNLDPLGLGRIDTRLLALARYDKGPAKSGRPVVSEETLAARRQLFSRRSTGDQALDGKAARRQGTMGRGNYNLSELRKRIMPGNNKFEPDTYLDLVHSDSTLSDLKQGRSNLKKELSERTGQMKALVKENFDRFISCKNTIDDIHVRLLNTEREDNDGAHGASTSDVIRAVSEVQIETRRAFASMLERASISERIRSVISLLKRYESLFRLPTRIRQQTERQEFDQVISEYRKAKGLMADAAKQDDTAGVWHNLYEEVEKGVEQMAKMLCRTLSTPRTPPAEAVEAIKHLLNLQADGARCAQDLDPVKLYMEAQGQNLHRLMDGASRDHEARLRVLRQRALEQKEAEARWKALQADDQGAAGMDVLNLRRRSKRKLTRSEKPILATDANLEPADVHLDADSLEAAEQLWLKFVSKLTTLLVKHMPEFWHMPEERLVSLTSISPRARKSIQAASEEAHNVVKVLLESYREKVDLALRELNIEGEQAKATFLAAVQACVAGCIQLRDAGGPKEVTEMLQRIIEAASKLCVGGLAGERAAMIAKLNELEDWQIMAASHKAGHPVSRVPGLLKDIVVRGTEQLQAVLKEGELADLEIADDTAASLREAFFDSFTVFAVAIEKLSTSLVPADDGDATAEPQEITPDRKLLVLLSNCVYMRTKALTTLYNRYEGLLTADGESRAATDAFEECSSYMQTVESSLLGLYLDSKSDLINGALEDFFYEGDDGGAWDEAPPPNGLRDAPLELISALVTVEAEVYVNAPSLRVRVMAQILEHAFSAFNSVVGEQLAKISIGGLLQLHLELTYLSSALGSLSKGPMAGLMETGLAGLTTRIEQRFSQVLKNKEIVSSEEAAELDSWVGLSPGGTMREKMAAASQRLLQESLRQTRANIVCFRG